MNTKQAARSSIFNAVSPFQTHQYRLRPDYSGPGLEPDETLVARIRERLTRLYGAESCDAVYAELLRHMRVHHAHATPEIANEEAKFKPSERFTERDIVMITYGDLVTSKTRSPLETLGDFAEVFFRGLITTIHILPFFPYSSDRGFAVVSYDEVDPNLGTWDDIAALNRSFKLMFDGVVNHCSAQSSMFQGFLDGDPSYRDHFISFESRDAIPPDALAAILRPRTSDLLTEFDTIDGPRYVWTTFSEDQVDLNFKAPEVMLSIVATLLDYVRRGADIIRLDAITYLWYELGTTCAHLDQTHEVVKLFRDILDVVAPHVALISETNVPHEDNITYFGDGNDEAQLVYNFALPPLALHAFLTSNAETLSGWAAKLETPSDTAMFFNFLDSHDGIGVMGARGILSEDDIQVMCDAVVAGGGQVGMKSNGDGSESPYELNATWLSALGGGNEDGIDTQVSRFIASRAVALAIQGVPAIYLPSMFGSENDIAAVQRDGVRRSINRKTIQEHELFEAFSDPDSIHTRIAKRFIDLIEKRTALPAFHPNAQQQVVNIDPRLFAVVRTPENGDGAVLCVVNVSKEDVDVDATAKQLGVIPGRYRNLIDESETELTDSPWHGHFVPYAVAWFTAQPEGD